MFLSSLFNTIFVMFLAIDDCILVLFVFYQKYYYMRVCIATDIDRMQCDEMSFSESQPYLAMTRDVR